MRIAAFGLALLVITAGAGADAAARKKPRPKPPQPAAILHISSHLAEPAKVDVDDRAHLTAPGYGVVETAAVPGRHVLKVTSEHGVNYTAQLDLKPDALYRIDGRAYWCVNLLEGSLQTYSAEECEMEVADRG